MKQGSTGQVPCGDDMSSHGWSAHWHKKSVIAASVATLLFTCVGVIGLALASGRLPASMGVVHAAGCSGSAASTPYSGPVGAVIAVCGSGWTSVADGTPVSFGYSTDPNCASNNTIVQNGQQGTMQGGNFSGSFRWPQNTSLTTYTVCAFIANIAAPPANTYTVLSTSPPQVTIAPTQIGPGQLVTITGYNYLPGGAFVSLTFQAANGGNSQSFGSTVSNSKGIFSISKTIPSNSVGSDTIVANSGAGQQPTLSASVTFTVSNPSTPTPPPTPRATPTATGMITPTALATATAIAKTPTSVIGLTPAATQNAGPGQTPTAGTTSNTSNTTQNSSQTSAGSGQSTSSPLPIAIGAGMLVVLLAALLIGVRVRSRRRRAAELAEALAPNNGPPWQGGNGLLTSYRNDAMNLVPVSPIPMNGGQMGPLNGGQRVPVGVGGGVGPIAAGNSAGQGQFPPSMQSQSAAGGGTMLATASASTPTRTGAGATGADRLLEAKMRQAQVGLFAYTRARSDKE